jgi:hypothetical protein
MQRNLAAKFSLPIILALMAAFIAGCQTTKPVDWNSRIGNYTFDQAVTELGPPDKQASTAMEAAASALARDFTAVASASARATASVKATATRF